VGRGGGAAIGVPVAVAGVGALINGYGSFSEGWREFTEAWAKGKDDATSEAGGNRGSSGKAPQEAGRPKSNVEQNRQARDAIRDYQRETGKILTRDQMRQAHDEFGKHEDANYHDLVEILKDTFDE